MPPAPDDSLLRILDANANRAAEALRVAEDVCRFHWNLPELARDLKELRHSVLRTIQDSGWDQKARLLARDIDGDVGRANASPPAAELSLPVLAQRNLQRAKEALRTLEEVSRAGFPASAPRLEELRYELYAVEKAIHTLGAGKTQSRLGAVGLYLLATSSLSQLPLRRAVELALEAGCGAVQLREKTMPHRELVGLARELRSITARAGALFIVNDRPDIARLAHADGVHLGQDDLSIAEARSLVGTEMLIGISTHSCEQAQLAARQGADYIGVGPAFTTQTKPEVGAGLGPERIRSIAESVTLPAFAIGGITAERAGQLAGCGCQGVAVSSAVLRATCPAEASRAILAQFAAR